jgi:tetratricopeptide (TPR) repeat protein
MKTIMCYIKRFLFLVCLQGIVCCAFAQQEALKEAETAYTQGDYAKAASLYRELLTTYGESAELYYNLGNVYYKDDKIASAVLFYERALLMDPGDADIRFNLEMAKQKTVDKIEPVGDFFLMKWFDDIQNMGATDSWAKLGIICFLLFIGCLFLFFFSRWIRMKKLGFYFGCLFLGIFLVANIFARNQKDELVRHTSAIVFSPTVTVKSSPNQSGNDLFILHEGTKVFIKSSLGEWNEIELEDGNIGWMPSKDIELI